MLLAMLVVDCNMEQDTNNQNYQSQLQYGLRCICRSISVGFRNQARPTHCKGMLRLVCSLVVVVVDIPESKRQTIFSFNGDPNSKLAPVALSHSLDDLFAPMNKCCWQQHPHFITAASYRPDLN